MTDFESRLWDYLADEYNADDIDMATARPIAGRARLQHRRLATSAGLTAVAAAVAAATVLLVGATTATRPAYALVQHPDGSVTVTVHNLRTAVKPLNARLAALGIAERIIPINDACPASNGGFVYTVKRSQFPQLRWTFTPRESRKFLSGGEWGYIGIGRSDSGQLLLAQGAMKPPLPSCLNSTLGQVISTSNSQ
jgi:hypothetical protein